MRLRFKRSSVFDLQDPDQPAPAPAPEKSKAKG
jgi:hypothetical protein